MLRVPFVFLWLSTEITIEASTPPSTTVVAYQPLWRYDDETKWPGHRCRSGGRRQSPIDINTAEVVPDLHRKFIKNGPLLFKGYDGVLVTGINNGHTIQFSTEGEEAMHPRLTGGPLNYLYRLEQLHFHWLAEHAIDGYKHPMEMHFVHVRTDLSVNEALAKRDGLAIIAVFCEVLSVLDDDPEDVIQLMQYIPKLTKPGDRISGILLDMRKLLSVNTKSYYAYSGSLTSPKCNEAVTWIIFPVPINISDSQYKLFNKISSGRHNYRRLQKLNQHVVYTPMSLKVPVPKFVIFFEDMIRVLGNFFSDMTTLVKESAAKIGIRR